MAIRLRLFTVDADILRSALRPLERTPVDADGGHGLARREDGAVLGAHVDAHGFGRSGVRHFRLHGEPGCRTSGCLRAGP